MKWIPSQDVEMHIVPGETPCESDIVIDINLGRRWKLRANVDDSGAQGTGTSYRLGFQSRR